MKTFRNLIILGTSHIAIESINDVKNIIESEEPKIIAKLLISFFVNSILINLLDHLHDLLLLLLMFSYLTLSILEVV